MWTPTFAQELPRKLLPTRAKAPPRQRRQQRAFPPRALISAAFDLDRRLSAAGRAG
jgi:hypothetical protein